MLTQVACLCEIGDVVSPGFFEDYLSSDSTAGVPHDSAEGYMYDYAINLQTLQYLEATRALEREAELKALEYMKSGNLALVPSWLSIDYQFIRNSLHLYIN